MPFPISPLRRWKPLAHYLVPSIRLYEAEDETLGCPLRLLCLGRNEATDYFLHQFFGHLPPSVKLSRWLRFRQRGAMLRGKPLDLIVRSIPWDLRRFYVRQGYLLYPEWINFYKDLRNPSGESFDTSNRSLSEDLRKVRRWQYHYELAGGPEVVRRFFERFAHPTEKAGAWAGKVLTPWDRFEAILRHGKVLFIRQGEEEVAGLAVVPQGGQVWFPFIGVRDGDLALRTRGAEAACYLFADRWAREQGFQRANWGLTRPLLSDGGYRFKCKWNLQPQIDPEMHFVGFRPLRPGLNLEERLPTPHVLKSPEPTQT
jgi:hypothetical protein